MFLILFLFVILLHACLTTRRHIQSIRFPDDLIHYEPMTFDRIRLKNPLARTRYQLSAAISTGCWYHLRSSRSWSSLVLHQRPLETTYCANVSTRPTRTQIKQEEKQKKSRENKRTIHQHNGDVDNHQPSTIDVSEPVNEVAHAGLDVLFTIYVCPTIFARSVHFSPSNRP